MIHLYRRHPASYRAQFVPVSERKRASTVHLSERSRLSILMQSVRRDWHHIHGGKKPLCESGIFENVVRKTNEKGIDSFVSSKVEKSARNLNFGCRSSRLGLVGINPHGSEALMMAGADKLRCCLRAFNSAHHNCDDNGEAIAYGMVLTSNRTLHGRVRVVLDHKTKR